MPEFVRTYIERYINSAWDDISSYVVGDIEGEYFIATPEPDDLLATVGELSLVIDNASGNFSPNTNFQRGTPIRVRTVYEGSSVTKFTGVILKIEPDTYTWGDQYCRVRCANWMQYAVDHPMTTPQIQNNITADEAVTYLLGQMDKQPDDVVLHEGRNTFSLVFDLVRKESRAYSELNKIALSEFAPIYMRGDGTLVVESADTRNGNRQLTTIPVRRSQSPAILSQPSGTVICTAGGIPILASNRFSPNLASGTYQPFDKSVENGDALKNRAIFTSHPTQVDASPILLWQLDVDNLTFSTFETRTFEGPYTNPTTNQKINAFDIQPLVTGTHYRLSDKDDVVDQSGQLVITEDFGADKWKLTVFNNGVKGILRYLKIYGYGIYPLNPISSPVSVTGSTSSYGVVEMAVDQVYQSDPLEGQRLAEIVTDDEKQPRNRLLSVTFDASLTPEMMQASQYMDAGDLTYVINQKNAIDTYAYIRGKRFVISPAGWVTEQWYLKETDNLYKGLKMTALRYTSLNSAHNGVNFGRSNTFNNVTQKTITGWIRNLGIPANFTPLAKYDGTNGWYFFTAGSGSFLYNHHFTPTDGQWETLTCPMTGSAGIWKHVALTYDSSSDLNVPQFYVDGLLVASVTTAAPNGTADTDADANLVLGNMNYVGWEFLYRHNGYLKDFRMYNRILPQSEIVEMASNPNNYTNVRDGLVWQGPCVKDEDFGNLTGTVLYPSNLIIDNVYGIRGTPHWNIPSGTAFAIRVFDPNF